MSTCKFCDAEIVWEYEFGKYTPLNEDGTVHRCELYKPDSKAKRSIKEKAKALGRHNWNLTKSRGGDE